MVLLDSFHPLIFWPFVGLVNGGLVIITLVNAPQITNCLADSQTLLQASFVSLIGRREREVWTGCAWLNSSRLLTDEMQTKCNELHLAPNASLKKSHSVQQVAVDGPI